MDRISRALEMARGGQTATAQRPQAPAPKEEGIGRIDYTETRQVAAPRRVLRRNRLIHGVDDERVTDAYRLLRTRVLHRMRQNGWITLGVTSTAPREGKTLTSVNLGLSIAKGVKNSVLVIDADLRRPTVHTLFGMKPEKGLSDYLTQETPLNELLINPGIERFVLLPGNVSGGVGPEDLSSPRMEGLVDDVRTRYRGRIVIFDLPPVMIGDDVVAFAPRLDALLLVVEEGGTDAQVFSRTVDLLDGVNVIGTVLNKSEEVSRSYGDYY